MTEITTDMNVLKNVVVFKLDVSLWSARKKLLHEDVGNIVLPPEELATLGSKRIAPPESLKIFSRLKSRAVSGLDRCGVRFVGGWAIPVSLIDKVTIGINAIRDDFVAEKEKFLQQYDTLITDWLNSNKEWKDLLGRSVVSSDYVRNRLQFKWQIYRIASTKQDSDLQEQVKQLGSNLFKEIADSANEMWTKSYMGRTIITHKALSPLKALEQKLMGLTFIEPHVAPIASMIHATIENIPQVGNIEGNDLITLQGLVCLLKDTEALLEHTDSLLKSNESQLPLAAYVELPKEEKKEELPPVLQSLPRISNSMGLW